MSRAIRQHIRNNIYGILALFIALGGTAVAAQHLPIASVTSGTIKNYSVKSEDMDFKSVRRAKLAPDAVTDVAVRDNSLTGADLDESSLDTSVVQSRVSGTCAADSSIASIGQDGTVSCEADDAGGADTAEEVLTKLLTVDGAGSGLDADQLDGFDSSDLKLVCPSGFQREDGLCWQSIDTGGQTFSQAADLCRQANGRLPSLDEVMGIVAGGIVLPNGGVSLDWIGDATSATQALYMSNGTTVSEQTVTNTQFARCVVEPRPGIGFGA